MKYLIGAICTIIICIAFSGRKCEHVFTQVEQATIKVERETWKISIYTAPPTGLQKGKELICVKCFHVQRQVLDYGEPAGQLRLSDFLLRSIDINCIDTIDTFNSGRVLTITGDTLY